MNPVTDEKQAVSATTAVNEANRPAKKGTRKSKAARKSTKTSKPSKTANARSSGRKQEGASERTNKKTEVTAIMQQGKGVTLAEIMKHTGWQAHTVRGLVSILGSKGGFTTESSKNTAGERSYKITK